MLSEKIVLFSRNVNVDIMLLNKTVSAYIHYAIFIL